MFSYCGECVAGVRDEQNRIPPLHIEFGPRFFPNPTTTIKQKAKLKPISRNPQIHNLYYSNTTKSDFSVENGKRKTKDVEHCGYRHLNTTLTSWSSNNIRVRCFRSHKNPTLHRRRVRAQVGKCPRRACGGQGRVKGESEMYGGHGKVKGEGRKGMRVPRLKHK